ncbi:nicotinate (nicotinamide) nucleotide adenylyltransferase [Fodinibius sp. SL11]|uniref:nicotinate (nicotinamide) nucleotide adenylyltransferase n=1 Tax=Fodinibius sp. SL11 TaxID=3425690 RepID=UPI003F883B38
MTALKRSIGILGGSFDPVHNGHLSIAESFENSGLIDELWVLLTPDPPHKKGKPQAAFQSRLKMLRAAFSGYDNIKVSDIEQQLTKPSYTIQTLRYMKDKYPDYSFYLCIGGDSLQNFKKWKEWQTILNYCDLLVAQRPSVDTKNIDPSLRDHIHFVDHEPVHISSTMIRNAIANGDDILDFVPLSVKQIIASKQLYREINDE